MSRESDLQALKNMKEEIVEIYNLSEMQKIKRRMRGAVRQNKIARTVCLCKKTRKFRTKAESRV